MDARRNLDLARELVAAVKRNAPLTSGAGEAECRCCVGRGYYAAFLTARQFLAETGIGIQRGAAAHTTVQFALNNSGVDLLARVAHQLRELYETRVAADYDLNDPEPEGVVTADTALGRAEFVFTAFDLIRSERVNPPVDLAAVATAILDWARANGQEGKLRRL